MSVVSASPSGRVLEEPRAAKKRRNGGWKGAQREGEGAPPPKKKREEGSSPVKGRGRSSRRNSTRFSPSTSVVAYTRPADPRSFRARDCLFLPPRKNDRKSKPRDFFLFVKLRSRRRVVFRVCARIPKDLNQSP